MRLNMMKGVGLGALIFCLSALPASLTAAQNPFDRASEEGGYDFGGKKNKKSKGKAKQEKGKDKDKDKKKPFEDVIEDMKKHEGLFNVYWDAEKHKMYMEIKPDQMETHYLCSPTVTKGLGRFIIGGAVWQEYPFEFKRVGDNVQMVLKNVWYRADNSETGQRAIKNSFSDSVLAQAEVKSKPHAETKGILIDPADLFLQDLEGISQFTKRAFKSSYTLDKKTSYFEGAKAFPENVEIGVSLNYTNKNPEQRFSVLPDPRSIQIGLNFSLSGLPETGYRPRLADERIGHFLAMYQDFSDDRSESPYVRYITRWHLEKEDPSAEVSPPKKPIVFWLENTIPEEHRPAIMEGALVWNDAFRKIGFSNAIQVKQQPDDADWDPADVRYSTIRWVVAPGIAFAQGPSRIHPFTGQIFDADIRIMEAFVRSTWHEYSEKVEPVTDAIPMIPMLHGQPRQMCLLQDGMKRQAVFGSNLLEARYGKPLNDILARKFVHDMLVSTICHEVGHTLGLRHNFKASTFLTKDQLQDEHLTLTRGLTGSIMDYTPVNLAQEGKDQGQYFQTTLGPYDYWATEYAYKPFSPENERAGLEEVLRMVSDAGLAYGTDEDAAGMQTRSIDPECNLWDLGDDPVAFYKDRFAIAKELWAKMPTFFDRPGERYSRLRRVFHMALSEYRIAAVNVPKYIGGVYHHRDHMGDPGGRLPLEPVPAAKQREALELITTEILGKNILRFDTDLLNRLAPEMRPNFEGGAWQISRLDYPIHDTIRSVQVRTLNRLFDEYTLNRVVDSAVKVNDKKPFTLEELFTEIREAVWEDLSTGEEIDSFRRNLHRLDTDILVKLMLKPSAGTPGDARTLARRDLQEIARRIKKHLDRGTYSRDSITRAHLDETYAKIRAALDAGVVRPL
ncbi:zinc-dependent metalloprotease [Acidobacteriota bacterium]